MVYYTREDVIITKEQVEKAGLKVGDLVYYSDNVNYCLNEADDDFGASIIQSIDWNSSLPFMVNETWWDCVIKKKFSEKKIVPFDFSLKEDRDAVIGKRIIHEKLGFDGYIWSFVKYKNGWQAEGMSAEDLKRNAVFAETGEPVGKEITV